MKDIRVSVVMITYNHEQYIKQAIEGVLIQETDFEVELIISNDASTDRTDEVVNEAIKNYKGKINIRYYNHKKNKGATNNFIWTLQQAQGKYIAICEGDDYWTDPLKLQKQVDFLEENEEYGMVHTQIKVKDLIHNTFSISQKDRKQNKFDELIYENPIATLTTCLRKDLILKYIKEVKPQEKNWVAGDLPIWLWISLHSKIHYLPDITAVYLKRAGSMSNTVTSRAYFNFVKSRLNIRIFFINNYSYSKKLIDYAYKDFYKDIEFHALKLKETKTIKEIAVFSLKEKKIIKLGYFYLMNKIYRLNIIYPLFFLIYRAYFKIKNKIR